MVVRKSQRIDTHSSRHQVASTSLVALALCGAACGQKPAPAPQPAPAVQAPLAQPPAPLPTFEFKAPAEWKSRDGKSTVPPPDLEAETWRIMVNQTEPMQRKNPWWQPLAAGKTVELEMPPGSKFRCMVSPLVTEVFTDEDQESLEAWDFKRTFACSSDDYHTWTETQLRVRQTAKGKRKVGPEAGIMLRARADDGKVVETWVMMRSDKEKTLPSYGPPRIIEQSKDDDE
jgi:hypothetical protein